MESCCDHPTGCPGIAVVCASHLHDYANAHQYILPVLRLHCTLPSTLASSTLSPPLKPFTRHQTHRPLTSSPHHPRHPTDRQSFFVWQSSINPLLAIIIVILITFTR
jgi:hypothetical protein